jgi:hypothetical protein
MGIRRSAGLGENIVAQSDKDGFNFDDFQYSGVKLTPLPDFNQDEPTADPAPAPPADAAADIPAASSEVASPLEPEDKKAKKKAKKEKPVKVKKQAASADAAVAEKNQFPFLKQLSETSPFTVLLGMTVVMLLLAVVFLLVELSRYDFDTKATKGKQAVVMAEPFGPPLAGYCMADGPRGPSEFSDLS